MATEMIIAGLSGALIIFMVYGMSVAYRVLDNKRSQKISLKDSLKISISSISQWVALILFLMFVPMLAIVWIGDILQAVLG